MTRAALLRSPRRFELVEREKPRPGPGEVVVRTAATAVCHTDLSIYTGEHPNVRYPVVLGHESTGVVDAVGEGVAGLQAGTPVIINPIIACGHCDACRRGVGNACRNAGLFGRELDGSLSQYVKLPSQYLYALPAALSLEMATLIETLATVRHAQIRAGVAPGVSVVVLGQGTGGLLHTRLAMLSGASPVIAVSRTRWKLEMAERMGAHHVVAAAAADAVEEVKRLTGGNGADVVIDAAGGAEAFRAGLAMLRPGGRFSVYSISHEPVEGFTTFPLYFGEVSLVGSRALTPQDMAPAIALVASGAVDVEGFISARYLLADAGAAFEEYERNPGRILRIVIDSAK
ncbi:MAG TPA: alcohol dehydrogenase catalytic domain-containing protein [Burkholderiales bacterium]|nr:alcohol dehydrogenase catalytic domain-containing protein [Burkholderiales bacterium]